jgi:hypothetical protein
MISLKKAMLTLVGVALIFSGSTTVVYSADIPDEQWNLPINAPGQDQAELIGMKIASTAAGLSYPSYIAGDSTGRGNKNDIQLCKSDSDPICAKAARTNYEAFLPPCDAQTTVNCISGVSAISASGVESSGIYKSNFPVKAPDDYPGNQSRNLPTGSDPSVWTIPGVMHGGGSDSYLVRFDVSGSATNGGTFHSDSIKVAIFPITTQTGNYTTGNMTDVNHPSGACINDHYGCGGIGSEHNGNSDSLSAACVGFDIGRCALRQAFPEGYRFKISAKLGDSPTGWFHGRIFNPQVSLVADGGITNITVLADAVKVPAVGAIIKQADMTPELKAYYAKYPDTGAFGRLSANGISNLIDSPSPSQPNVFEDYSAWSSIFKDKASATQSEWSFRTLELNGQDNSCFRDTTKLVGIVSTNAMMYSGGAPSLNQSEGTLDYKVGAPHFASNGDVFKGSYDLQLRSDVARCLYKFSSAPIRATISVANSNGDANVATTIFSEDKTTGWIRMSASNFLFSSPTVKIKLTQDAPAPTPTPVATPEPTPSASTTPIMTATPTPQPVISTPKKITITCIKGKTTKTVTAVKPTCPTGYKRK